MRLGFPYEKMEMWVWGRSKRQVGLKRKCHRGKGKYEEKMKVKCNLKKRTIFNF